MRSSEYYAWDTQAMVPQSVVLPFVKDELLAADVEGEVAEMATSPNDGISETKGTAVQVTKFEVPHHCDEDLLPRVNQNNNPKISLRDTSDA